MLNERLYRGLQERFGEVRVANEGEARETVRVGDTYEARTSGEQYRVCCPFCRETRFRLYVSYMWNTVDPEGIPNSHLAVCFNEHCDVDSLRDELQAYLRDRPTIGRDPTLPYRPPAPMFQEVAFPGQCVSLAKLEPDHDAIRYLKGRNFDPAEIVYYYNVHFCMEADADERGYIAGTKWSAVCCKNRLVIPIYRLGVMVGWQTRALNNVSHPKYYTMPGLKKSHLIYNGDLCQHYDFGVIVEGVTDVWRLGPCGGAIFGHMISNAQLELIYSYWQLKGGMCLMLDPDVMENVKEVERWVDWKSFLLGAFPLCLQGVEDPGAMDRRELWDTISSLARNRGIRLVRV